MTTKREPGMRVASFPPCRVSGGMHLVIDGECECGWRPLASVASGICGHVDEGWEEFPCTKAPGHKGDHETRLALSPEKKKSPRRSGAVLVLMTPEEREECRAAAQDAGIALTGWLRVVALAAARNADPRALWDFVAKAGR